MHGRPSNSERFRILTHGIRSIPTGFGRCLSEKARNGLTTASLMRFWAAGNSPACSAGAAVYRSRSVPAWAFGQPTGSSRPRLS
ncbi:MAG: hypothetical protein DMG68_02260 [Acidobacteria bacterium]|nr:MAG: hypothetical protein DMG68_02260 [Acidobacteriota bacterium]